MVWPDITRRIWSYIIAKLGIFTNVDPSKLELSATCLRLNDLEVDRSKLDIPGFDTTRFQIAQVGLELNSSGLVIRAEKVNIELILEKMHPPELAISMLIDATKQDIASEITDVPLPTINESTPNDSGFVSRVADLALSKVTAHLSDVNLDIRIGDLLTIGVHIDEVILSSKHRIELESITITCMEQDVMAKSIYFDTFTSLMSAPAIILVDHVLLDFSSDTMWFTFNADNTRVSGLAVLKAMVTVLNEAVYGDSYSAAKDEDKQEDKQEEMEEMKKTICEFSMNRLEIYESLDGSLQPLRLFDIRIAGSDVGIETLDLPGIVHISPFLAVRLDSNGPVRAEVKVPICINVPLESLYTLKQLVDNICEIMTELEPPDDTEQTPFNVVLPDIRLSVDHGITLLIFPQELTDKSVRLSEVLLTAGDGQVLISNFKFEFNYGLFSDRAVIKLTDTFMEELQLVKSEFLSKQVTDEAVDVTPEEEGAGWTGIETLPELEFKVQHFEIDGFKSEWGANGLIECSLSNALTTCRADVSGHYANSSLQVEILASSSDKFRSIDSTFRLKDCDFSFELKKNESKEDDIQVGEKEKKKTTNYGTYIPIIRSEVKFDNDVKLHLGSKNTSLSIENSSFTIDQFNKSSAHIPRLVFGFFDTAEDHAAHIIELIKIKDLKYTQRPGLKSMVLGHSAFYTCADSYCWIKSVIAYLIPDSQPPTFFTELESTIDVFDGMSEAYFVPSNLKFPDPGVPAMMIDSQIHKLDIQDNFMDKEIQAAKKGLRASLVEYEAVTALSSFEIKFKSLQWQFFDGYDFESTHTRVMDAIDRLSTATKASAADTANEDSDSIESDDDSSDGSGASTPLVGDLMYNSMFISAPRKTATAETLNRQVADEIGSKDLTRGAEPKLLLTLRRLKVTTRQLETEQSTLMLSLRDGKVTDLVPTSAVNDLLAPLDPQVHHHRDILVYSQASAGTKAAPEQRVVLAVRPLHLRLDQDTGEFVTRFFQFNLDENNAKDVQEDNKSGAPYFQRFEFSGLPLVMDYTPKKVDFRSLRSGATTELLNLFAVKGAKVTLKPSVMYGISGWDVVMQELVSHWAPDIRGNQLGGLLSGLTPVRKALKVTKRVNKYAVKPVKRTQVTKGAGAVIRRTLDELLRLGQGWMESSDQALGGL